MRSLREASVGRFAADLVRDLRDARLLPVVVVLLVLLAAVPVLLAASGGSGSQGSSSSVPPAAKTPAEARVAVLAESHGVRDFRKRLRALDSRDPFEQRFTAPTEDAGGAGSLVPSPLTASSPGAGSAATEPNASLPEPGLDPVVPEEPTQPGGEDQTEIESPSPETNLVEYRTDVRVGEVGHLKMRRDVQPLDFLPGNGNPVLVFLGTTADHGKAMFLIDYEARSISGEGGCLRVAGACSVLILRPGQGATVTLALSGRSFRVSVVRIDRLTRRIG